MSSFQYPIIFDLDGTLIDSKPEIVDTYRKVFQKISPPVEQDFQKMNFGATLQVVMESVYPGQPEMVQHAKKIFAEIYDSSDYAGTLLYDSVYETLETLKQRGHTLFIATNKRHKPTIRILDLKNLTSFFSDVVTSDSIPGNILTKEGMISRLKGKHAFKKGVMVGDSASDIQAGKTEGLLTIAVTYGYENRDIFAVQNPAFTIDSIDEMLNLLPGKL